MFPPRIPHQCAILLGATSWGDDLCICTLCGAYGSFVLLSGCDWREAGPCNVAACTDVPEGWRPHRTDGGAIPNVETCETILRSLSIPHSPRVHDSKLWFHNSGFGGVGRTALEGGPFTPVCFARGSLPGPSFHNNFAVMKLSKPRHATFQGLALGDRLKQESTAPTCGVAIRQRIQRRSI